MAYSHWFAKWERKLASARTERETLAILKAQNAEFNRIASTLDYDA